MEVFVIRTEPRFATHDGFLPPPSPPPRHLLTDRDAIVDRMARDMLDIRRTRGHVMVNDLMEAGWSIAQVRAYNATAAIHADEIASGARA